MIARRHLPPLAAAEAWCAELPIGSLIRVSYEGGAMDHARIVLWPSRRRDARGRQRGKSTCWVLSADGDVWEEDLGGKSPATGPSGGSILGQVTGDPPDGRRLCRFLSLPSLGEILERAAECRETMLGRGQRESEGAEHVMLPDGVERPGREYFPFLMGERPWVLAEPVPGMPVGTVVDPLPEGVARAGSQALARLSGGGRWARLEQVDADAIVEWAAGRLEELRGLLGAAPLPAPAGSAVGGAEAPPPRAPVDHPGPDHLAAEVGLADEPDARRETAPEGPNNDVRTLWVDWGEQGERRKDFRRAVAESSNVEWDRHRLPSDRTCLHTCKMMMMSLNGSPRAWLERFLRGKGVASTDRVARELRVLCDILEEAGEFDQLNRGGWACLEVAALRLNLLVDAHGTSGAASYSNAKYLSPLTEVDQLVAPGLRSHVSRRAKEEYELLQGDRKAEAAALSALLKGCSIYDASGSPRRPIHDIDFHNLPTSYFDPLLKRSKKKCHSFLKDHVTRSLAGNFDAFGAGWPLFREKSDGHKMRMIVDARRASAWFNVPPSVQLLSCEGFGRVEVRLPEGVAIGSARAEELLGKFRLFLGITDVKGCFYRMRIPLSLAKFLSLPAAPAHVLGLAGQELEGARLGPDTLVSPCIGALPMGFSWSLFLAQGANEERVVSSNPWPGGDMTISERLLMSDRGPPLVIDVEPGRVGGAYVYVDNLGVDLDLHESSVTSSACEALGAKLDLELMRSGVSDGRVWKVCMGLGGLLARGRATGRALEMVLGHCAFCGLALRGSLSCWRASYRFIQRHYLEPARLWLEVMKEVRLFRGLLVLMVQDWWRPWNSCVLQTDASESGWGMAQLFWPLRVVEDVGRLPERARFRSAQGRPARESALAAASLVQDSSGMIRSVESVMHEDSSEPDALSAWDVDPDFAEVPWEWLRKGAWETVRSGAWRFPEGIFILEARALVKAVQRRLRGLSALVVRELPLPSRRQVPSDSDGRAGADGQAARKERHFAALDDRGANGQDPAGDGGEAAEGDSSSSGSDSGIERPRRSRVRMQQLRARGAQRRAKLNADAILAAQDAGVSPLGDLGRDAADAGEVPALPDLSCSRVGLKQEDILARADAEIDEMSSNDLTENCLLGEQSSYGDQTMAAWVSANPDFGRIGGRLLPCALRRLTPGRRRKALALPVWCGLAWKPVRRGHLRLALFLAAGVSTCSRPSTLLAAQRCDLAPPTTGASRHWALLTHSRKRREPSKRGHFDQACPLDSPCLQGWDAVFKSRHRYEHSS
ncbi:unnamed protein product, partial [Prorocentrum cordatum]